VVWRDASTNDRKQLFSARPAQACSGILSTRTMACAPGSLHYSNKGLYTIGKEINLVIVRSSERRQKSALQIRGRLTSTFFIQEMNHNISSQYLVIQTGNILDILPPT
jgi:hypothetical protein